MQQLSTQVAALEDKCEDLEVRYRRNNIRIVGVPEGQSSCSTTAVSVLLKEAFEGLRFGILHPARLRITYNAVDEAQKYITQDITK